VLQACDAMRAGDAVTLGRLLDASHVSLRDDFEVSCRELDTIVEIAAAHTACLGARMTGGGFGGCAVALVQEDAAQAFAASTSSAYAAATGLTPRVYVCHATDGAAIVGG
jgi:galactokinase